MQEKDTNSVIDGSVVPLNGAFVLTHNHILAEMKRQIDSGTIKQAEVARKLGIAPARVAEMRKDKRRIQPDELPKLANLLGLTYDRYDGTVPIREVALIPNLGNVAQGVWLEQSVREPEVSLRVAYDRKAGDPSPTDLFAVTPMGTSMNRVFRPGTQLICRRVPFTDYRLAEGDYVIVERAAHDLHEMTCKRVQRDREGMYWLHSESDDPQYAEPWPIGRPDNGMHVDNEIRIIGKVIRAVIDFENGPPNI